MGAKTKLVGAVINKVMKSFKIRKKLLKLSKEITETKIVSKKSEAMLKTYDIKGPNLKLKTVVEMQKTTVRIPSKDKSKKRIFTEPGAKKYYQ